MRVDEAEQELRRMLSATGLDLARLDPEAAWQVFREFAAQPVKGTGGDPDDDMLLFEYGVYDWSDGKGSRFQWSLCRQFTLYVDGEYDHMEHLRCDLFFAATPNLEQVGENALFFPSGSLDAWVTEVEQFDGFAAVFGMEPVESEVRHEDV